jgi:hypothetical protein
MALYAFTIEPILYFGIGFLVAAFVGLAVVPLDWPDRLHGRAVRLNLRRLEGATASMTNILADRDRLRAEFILSMQRLENSVERMKIQAAKKGDAIKRLKVELGEKTTAISVLEARKKTRRDQSCVRKAESKRSRLRSRTRHRPAFSAGKFDRAAAAREKRP